jgi:hypothetical protein
MRLDVVVFGPTMNKLLQFQRSRGLGAVASLGWLLATLLGASGAEVSRNGTGKPEPLAAIDLVYQEVPDSFINWGTTVLTRSNPFQHEPAFGSHRITRGTLRLGREATNAVGFVWDRTAGKLYLDLNRNQDLGDDAAGVFTTRAGYTDNYQSFTNVHLVFPGPGGPRRLAADLNFYEYSSNLNCTAGMRSFWEGKLSLNGADWQVGIIEDPSETSAAGGSRRLLLRPWAARGQPFSTYTGASRAWPFARKVFFGQHAYDLDLTTVPERDNVKFRLRLTEEHPALGELKLTGQFIERLVLEGGTYLVLLDQPPGVVRIPVGSYGESQVQLKKGNTTAYRQDRYPASGRRISIGEQQPAELTAGGPLTNRVTVTRRGASLYLVYQLKGTDGELYTVDSQGREKPPEFVVSQGGKRIGSGKFEFG